MDIKDTNDLLFNFHVFPTGELPSKGSNGRRPLAAIKYAVVHHDAVLAPESYDPISRYHAEATYHVSKGWGRIGYAFKVARDGRIYQLNPLEEIAYHAGNSAYNRNSIGICLDGDFSKQQPSVPQMSALRELLDWLTGQRPDLPLLVRKTIRYHREVRWPPLSTFCPGPVVSDFVKRYRA